MCSEPLVGREEPATAIEMPEMMMGLIETQTLSSRLGLMAAAFSIMDSAAYLARLAALELKSSDLSRSASCQSMIAVELDITSAHPEASSRYGALTMSAVSAMTPMGTFAWSESEFPPSLMDALGLAMPSWDADVGTLRNGILRLSEGSFARWALAPPPTPMRNEALTSFATSSTLTRFCWVAGPTSTCWTSYLLCSRDSRTSPAASLPVVGPVTIRTVPLSSNSSHTVPVWLTQSGPARTCLGKFIAP